MTEHEILIAISALSREIEVLRFQNEKLEKENAELRSNMRIKIHIEKEDAE
jgi:hypothetical protein